MTATQLRGSKAAINEVYEDLRELVDGTARKFAERYNQPRDECRAEANLIFLRAYHSFDPDRIGVDATRPRAGRLAVRVRQLIWCRLLDGVRHRAKRHAKAAFVPGVDLGRFAAPEPPPAFDRHEFFDRLSADARCVVSLLLDSLPEISAAVGAADPALDRTVLRWFLAGMGWTAGRIADAFTEIGGAL